MVYLRLGGQTRFKHAFRIMAKHPGIKSLLKFYYQTMVEPKDNGLEETIFRKFEKKVKKNQF